jgi:hypothetical protein
MKNLLFFISIESIESLESLEPQYRFGLESVDTEKSVSIGNSNANRKLRRRLTALKFNTWTIQNSYR